MRRTLWKWHGWLGLFTALPLFIVALTGSLLVFKAEIDQWLMPEIVYAENSQRLPFDLLVKQADKALPDYEILAWDFAKEPGQSDLVYSAKYGSYDWTLFYVDPSNARLLSEPAPYNDYFTNWVLDLHQTLLADHYGLMITALVSLLLIFLALSGFILHKQFWRTFFTLRWNKSLRLFLSDGHKMLGIIGAPLFLIFGFTGAWWNIEHLIEEIDEPDPAQFIITQAYYNKGINLDSVLTEASHAIDKFETHFVRFPDKSYPGIHLFGSASDKGMIRSDYGSIISFDDQSGKQTSALDVTKSPALYQFTDTFKPLHFGDFAGLTVKIIWCVVGFFPCLMALSGFIMWRKRRPAKSRRQSQRRASTISQAKARKQADLTAS
ncbi:PepSY domain-containing protein [Shewanella sp. AS1]|uniref:PepSY-associated TM helix domain-containing protein n=1 Tax=Shewanella sp. AS1 TaxID=2907626 RepID=UPI001F364A0D|nr:PepSY-associated TM helix domain-containing protein [Shewanella sp. AS1]MCE9678062.1 PepSY domain-containing protein [Shewanella sp. AS1]